MCSVTLHQWRIPVWEPTWALPHWIQRQKLNSVFCSAPWACQSLWSPRIPLIHMGTGEMLWFLTICLVDDFLHWLDFHGIFLFYKKEFDQLISMLSALSEHLILYFSSYSPGSLSKVRQVLSLGLLLISSLTTSMNSWLLTSFTADFYHSFFKRLRRSSASCLLCLLNLLIVYLKRKISSV